jgi:2-hydroxyacyl-CoA lyase 1
LPVQAAGIRSISFRNEQAAGYAAAACGFLTGAPGVLLTVSGPGAVHGIAGLSHAQINCWPMLMLSGSAEQARSDYSRSLAACAPLRKGFPSSRDS